MAAHAFLRTARIISVTRSTGAFPTSARHWAIPRKRTRGAWASGIPIRHRRRLLASPHQGQADCFGDAAARSAWQGHFAFSRHPSGGRRRHAGSTQALNNKGFHNHLVRDEGIAGSNPATPTTQRSFLRAIPRHEARRSAVLKRCFILQLSFILNPIITASLAD